jgi:hypothetical protein
MEAVEEGFPDWTELGQDSGLDPLGMQRPIEAIYQSLIPGISTITLRYRYYSLFPFILKHYEDTIRNPDPIVFRSFYRRCEALYALICTHGGRELGITGSDWAAEILASQAASGVIDFSQGADAEADEKLRYLKNKGGAFGAIYSTQMREMGLLIFAAKDDPNPNPVCAKLALPLAKAFAEEIGDLAPRFFELVERAEVAIAELADFETMKPSRLRLGSNEHTLLKDVLLGKADGQAEFDLVRQATLKMLLQSADQEGAIPEMEDIKWQWFDSAAGAPQSVLRVPELWALFQTCDLIRLAYETILSAALVALSDAPRNRMPLTALVEELSDQANVPESETWQDFASKPGVGGDTARAHAQQMLEGSGEERVQGAVKLIACLWANAPVGEDLIQKALSGEDYFYSLRTEIRFLNAVAALPARDVVSQIMSDRVLKRHLWVASRKFRKQKAYTYHLEPEEGLLRYRSQFHVAPSSPRIEQALRFLKDISLIDENGVTSYGRAELAAA